MVGARVLDQASTHMHTDTLVGRLHLIDTNPPPFFLLSEQMFGLHAM